MAERRDAGSGADVPDRLELRKFPLNCQEAGKILLTKRGEYVMIQCVFKRRRLLNGEMSEWLKEPVLKTGGAQVPVGSNPTHSAKF